MFIIEHFDHEDDWQALTVLGEHSTRLAAVKARDKYFASMKSAVICANKNYYRITEK